MTTIKQIANLAGVSRGTVDRVLNNRIGVNPETERQIREIAAMVNYVPNKAGKTLAIKKKSLKFGVALLNSKSSNPFISDLTKGARQQSKELADYGVSVEFRQTQIGHPDQQLVCIDELVQSGINGLVIMPENHIRISERLRALKERGIAVVTVNSDIQGAERLAYVGSNYYQAGETAAGLMALITSGKAKIAIVTGSTDILCHAARIDGFLDRAAAQYPGLQVVATVANRDDDFESFERTKDLLLNYPELEALYLTAGGVFGACRAVQDYGLGGRIKIICFDTVSTTQAMLKDGIVMAAIDQQPLLQGAKALSLLFDHMGMELPVKTEFFYTENVIKISENL